MARITPPLGVPSSFVSTMPVISATELEFTRLIDRVLPGRRIQHKQHFTVGVRRFALNDAVDFRKLFHQVLFIVQAARRVADYNVGTA